MIGILTDDIMSFIMYNSIIISIKWKFLNMHFSI